MISWLYWLTWTATLGPNLRCGLADAGMVSTYFHVDLDHYFCITIFVLNLSSTRILLNLNFGLHWLKW